MLKTDVGEYVFCELTEEHLEETAVLLNNEWPRSMMMRMRNLKSSMESLGTVDLPKSFVLLQKSTKNIIGHLKLNFIQISGERSEELAQIFDSVYLQSLVIQKELRGKGLGKLMMSLAEDFLAKNFHNFKILYLNTKDQQRFYESIGYVRTERFLFHVIESKKSACSKMISNLLGSLNTGSRLATANDSANNEQFGNTWYKKSF